MKKITSFIILAVIYAAIFGCTKNIPNESGTNKSASSIFSRTSTSDPTMAPGLYEEFPVDLSPCVLDLTTLGSWGNDFLSHFKFSSTFTSEQSQSVSSASLLAVFNKMSNDGTHKPGKYFRGLRMIYGATSEGAIKLLFVPVYADSTGLDSTKTQFALSPSGTDMGSLSGNRIYICQEGALVEISGSSDQMTMAKEWIATYRANIQIKPTDDGGSFRNQVDGVDANAAFVPFQEIIALIEDNNATSIKFTSIGKITLPGNIYRHDLAMVPTTFSGTGSGQFTNLAADYTQLCPPACSIVNYGKASF